MSARDRADPAVRVLSTAAPEFDEALSGLKYWQTEEEAAVAKIVADVLADVRTRGDAALLELTRRFDRIDAPDVAALAVEPPALAEAFERIGRDDQAALALAADRIRDYHRHQLDDGFMFTDEYGSRFGQRVTPLDRVGVYVPGGRAAYPSTVLMTVLPARVAGVGEIVVTVPTPDGERNDHVLAALHVAGVDAVFALGGAQAIAALAFGTATIAKVDKIVGPGGAFVAAAKRQVFGPVGIDSIAGPSEILIVADGTVPARWTALDLFSQAEHDPAAQALLLCPDASYVERVRDEIARLLPAMSRREIIGESLARRGALIVTRDLDEAVAIANDMAPEHLQLAVAEPERWLPEVRHAGAIFLGSGSAEVLGDYNAGPSHVLPTFGTARYASPLGVYDFQKRSSVLSCSPQGAAALGRSAARIARAEGLDAHALAALARAEGDNEG